jgi:predicted dehydrogenase
MNRRAFLESIAVTSAGVLVGGTTALGQGATEARRYRVGIIGHTGRGGFGHGLDSMWANVGRTEVVGWADAGAKPEAVAAASNKYPGARCFSDYVRMLEEVRPDVVAVCPRSVEQHSAMVHAAAAAGVRGVYMEKPFVRDLEEADGIVALCCEKGLRVALAHRNRYHPALPVAVELLRAGRFGRLLEARGRGKEDGRGGALDLWVLGSHVLNLATVFVGRPMACTGLLYQNGKPVVRGDLREGEEGLGLLGGNAVHARFETEAGVPLYFDSVQNAGAKAAGFGLQLICSEAVVDLRVDAEPLVHVRWGNPFRPVPAVGGWEAITSAGIGQPEPEQDIRRLVGGHVAPAKDLLEAIEQRREPLCGAEAGRMTVEMILAVFESHRRGGERVSFPLENRLNALGLLPAAH